MVDYQGMLTPLPLREALNPGDRIPSGACILCFGSNVQDLVDAVVEAVDVVNPDDRHPKPSAAPATAPLNVCVLYKYKGV